MYPPSSRTRLCVKAIILYITLLTAMQIIFYEHELPQAPVVTRHRRNEPLEFSDYSNSVIAPVFYSNFVTVVTEILKNINTSPAPVELPSEEEEEWELNSERNVPELSMLMRNDSRRPKWHSSACARFPDLFTVRFSNVYWQVQETTVETYYLYSAYLDMRGDPSPHPNHPFDNALVRVLAMSNRMNLNGLKSRLTSCQFWFSHRTTPVFGKVNDIIMLWNQKWGRNAEYFPYLLTCKVPKGLRNFPVSVSLVPSRCSNATNNLNIIHRNRVLDRHANSSPQNGIGVCVKALDFPDVNMRSRLIEWIEILRLLGAAKIFFYEYFVDNDIARVLKYYNNIGAVNVTHTTLPGSLPNQAQLRHHYIRKMTIQKRLTELIPYNDCFYRNMYDFEYIAIMDTDELLVPTDNITWSDLINIVKEDDIGLTTIKTQPVTTFCFRNFYYLDEMMEGKEHDASAIPQEFHMLRHIYRSETSTGWGYMKCFHSTAETAGLHNHFALFCREGTRCVRYYIKETRGHMNHYRPTCVRDLKNCSRYLSNPVKDTTLWRYKDQVTSRMETIRNALNF